MALKINRRFGIKIVCVTLSLFLAIFPFFQPKRVEASPMLFLGIAAVLTTGIVAGGYARDAVLTPEQLQQTNDKMTANLKQAFPDPAEYNKQLGVIQNLDNDIKQGKEVDWSKYPGKVIYPVLKGIIDVLYPINNNCDDGSPGGYTYYGETMDHAVYLDNRYNFGILTSGWSVSIQEGTSYFILEHDGKKQSIYPMQPFFVWDKVNKRQSLPTIHASVSSGIGPNIELFYGSSVFVESHKDSVALASVLGVFPVHLNARLVPDITAKTANKIKLPTRLPQTVINNINNYYNGDTENLTINPTPEELPTLPDGYNPNTDPLPDLPGYEDVTPDQPGTTDPEPTPTPSPEPTPEPTPNPDYNGDKWVNPIGDFMDGLLKFMKAAFVPTLTLNLDALNTMPDNLGEKFPFSLPSDLVRMFSIFQAEPKPFTFDWELDFTSIGAGTIPIKGDISMFDEYAPLFRNLAFIGFLIGLAWRTFGMFFGGGDE